MTRTVDEWIAIFEPLAAEPMPEIARRVLGDIIHYIHGRAHEESDCEELGNAMQAWERLSRK